MNKSIEPIFKLLQRLNTQNTPYQELKEFDKTIEILLNCHFVALRDKANESDIENISSLKDDDLICLTKKGKIWIELCTHNINNTDFVKKENYLTIDNFKDLIDDECFLYNAETIKLNVKSYVEKYFEDLLKSLGGKYNSECNKSIIYQAINCYTRMIKPNIKQVYSLSSVFESLEALEDSEQKNIIKGLDLIRSYIANNKVLSPFLSKNVFNNQDGDQLNTDWNVKHLHINDIFDDDGHIKLSKYSLMCVEKDNILYFIDIVKHDQKDTWCNTKLMDIIKDNQLKGVLLDCDDTHKKHTQEGLKAFFDMRDNSISIDNNIFINMNTGKAVDGLNSPTKRQETQIYGKIWKYQYVFDRYTFFNKCGKLELKITDDSTKFKYGFAIGTSLLHACLYEDGIPIKVPTKVDVNSLYFE